MFKTRQSNYLREYKKTFKQDIPAEGTLQYLALQAMVNKNFQLINRKGEYPYEFVSSFDKLDTPLSELTREDFYSLLKKEHLTDEQLEHVPEVIKAFKFKTLKQYHDLYLPINVVVLQT